MFAYCLNNPVRRRDASGDTSEDIFDGDGNPATDDDLRFDGGKISNGGSSGGGGNSAYTQSTGRGFLSFQTLKNFLGSAGKNMHWHHIVEQCQIRLSGFSSAQIHNTANVIAIDQATHARITGYYNTTTFEFTNGMSVRYYLAGQPYEVQYNFGMNVLREFEVIK